LKLGLNTAATDHLDPLGVRLGVEALAIAFSIGQAHLP
jgi:hypothetical protein